MNFTISPIFSILSEKPYGFRLTFIYLNSVSRDTYINSLPGLWKKPAVCQSFYRYSCHSGKAKLPENRIFRKAKGRVREYGKEFVGIFRDSGIPFPRRPSSLPWGRSSWKRGADLLLYENGHHGNDDRLHWKKLRTSHKRPFPNRFLILKQDSKSRLSKAGFCNFRLFLTIRVLTGQHLAVPIYSFRPVTVIE